MDNQPTGRGLLLTEWNKRKATLKSELIKYIIQGDYIKWNLR